MQHQSITGVNIGVQDSKANNVIVQDNVQSLFKPDEDLQKLFMRAGARKKPRYEDDSILAKTETAKVIGTDVADFKFPQSLDPSTRDDQILYSGQAQILEIMSSEADSASRSDEANSRPVLQGVYNPQVTIKT